MQGRAEEVGDAIDVGFREVNNVGDVGRGESCRCRRKPSRWLWMAPVTMVDGVAALVTSKV